MATKKKVEQDIRVFDINPVVHTKCAGVCCPGDADVIVELEYGPDNFRMSVPLCDGCAALLPEIED